MQLADNPGPPIGYAPIYAPSSVPPLAQGDSAPVPVASAGASRLERGAWAVAFGVASVACLLTWGVLDRVYSGADIRAMEREVERSERSAVVAEQRAVLAERSAQQWEQYSGAQGQTIEGVRGLVCR